MKNDLKGSKLNLKFNEATKQLLMGSGAGWLTGFVAIKAGRPAAFLVGGGILMFQLAQTQGFIKADWDTVRQKANAAATEKNAKSLSSVLTKAKGYAKTNTAFTAGFVGGFLLGLAS